MGEEETSLPPTWNRVKVNWKINGSVHRLALCAIRGELLERERKKVRDIVLGYYTWVTYYPL